MHYEVWNKIHNNPMYQQYLRENSFWYKKLNRDKNAFQEFENNVKNDYHLRKSDKILNIVDKIEMGRVLFEMIRK